jgi:hypothetical protein
MDHVQVRDAWFTHQLRHIDWQFAQASTPQEKFDAADDKVSTLWNMRMNVLTCEAITSIDSDWQRVRLVEITTLTMTAVQIRHYQSVVLASTQEQQTLQAETNSNASTDELDELDGLGAMMDQL